MRFLMQISIPVEKFNQALRDGTGAKKLNRILDDAKPEAAYFTSQDGCRGGYLVVNLESTSEMPRLSEPWFLNFNATVQFLPVMVPEDLQKAGLEEIVKKWG